MSRLAVAVLVVVVLLVVAAVTAVLLRRRRSARLRSVFGEEYERTVESAGARKPAERALQDRQQRHAQLQIRPLTPERRARYLSAWEGVQSRFVERPVLALSEADTILTQLLAERGFPTDDPSTSAEMLSVAHRHVLDSFRAGHAIEQANSSQRSDTEQVRQGMLHFHSVFEALLEDATPYPGGGPRQSSHRRP